MHRTEIDISFVKRLFFVCSRQVKDGNEGGSGSGCFRVLLAPSILYYGQHFIAHHWLTRRARTAHTAALCSCTRRRHRGMTRKKEFAGGCTTHAHHHHEHYHAYHDRHRQPPLPAPKPTDAHAQSHGHSHPRDRPADRPTDTIAEWVSKK